MTQEREENLIADVGELKGMVHRFLTEWDAKKDTLASQAELSCVDKKIDDHLNDGRHRTNMVAQWVAIGAASVAAAIGYFKH